MPRPDDDEAMWLIDVPDQHVATVAGWCSPFPGRHGFFPLAARGEAVHSPLVPLLAFTTAWEPPTADLDLSQIDPLLALMVTMRTGTLNDARGLPDGWEPRLLTAGPDDVPALAGLALTGAAGPAFSKIGYMREQPLERSMLGMRRMAPARARRPPWVVVVGGTCADFCFALACDRLLGGATWLPLTRLPGPVLDAGFSALSRHITTASTMNGTRIPVTSVSLDEAGMEEAREQLRARGGSAFHRRAHRGDGVRRAHVHLPGPAR